MSKNIGDDLISIPSEMDIPTGYIPKSSLYISSTLKVWTLTGRMYT